MGHNLWLKLYTVKNKSLTLSWPIVSIVTFSCLAISCKKRLISSRVWTTSNEWFDGLSMVMVERKLAMKIKLAPLPISKAVKRSMSHKWQKNTRPHRFDAKYRLRSSNPWQNNNDYYSRSFFLRTSEKVVSIPRKYQLLMCMNMIK